MGLDWPSLFSGETAGELRAAAVFDVTVGDPQPGDAREVAIAWPPDARPVLADHDIFGGERDFRLVSTQELEEIDAAPWVLEGLGEVWATGSVPGVGDVVADAAPMRMRRAFGPDAGGLPAEGWIASVHEDGGDIDHPWWVFLDERGVPRRAFSSRASRPA